ncbi:glutamate racemase [Clostridium sp. 19966]|uniref:glutamate racemase n=1 Tax=Clostridium sp. 19966 TaxID=2768166 RepID=UPI0028DF0334|nr:glutamate racemase [Clostridium sp. 19966]MDT8716752.1 glutamate racemase [Clostridium sp. 19966]
MTYLNPEAAIGFFDSGVGGLSVLKAAKELMPAEDFIYFGDSLNAPYGVKSIDEIRDLSFAAAEFLLKKQVKAIVVACNTATSAAIDDLRDFYSEIPIIGIEPALKPAVELNKDGKILVMATPVTLAEKKFNSLMIRYGKHSDIIPVPCAGLAELVEEGETSGKKINTYLCNILNDHLSTPIASIVLGCTHYPFIKKELLKLVGEEVAIIDGSYGTSYQLKRLLSKRALLSSKNTEGKISIFNSLNTKEIMDLSMHLLNL